MRLEIAEPTQKRAMEPSAPPMAINRYFCKDVLPSIRLYRSSVAIPRETAGKHEERAALARNFVAQHFSREANTQAGASGFRKSLQGPSRG
jgi:hypothetical protein